MPGLEEVCGFGVGAFVGGVVGGWGVFGGDEQGGAGVGVGLVVLVEGDVVVVVVVVVVVGGWW